MTHDCRLRSLEVFEDPDGYLFVKDQCGMPFGREHFSRVEYCPVCGMKSKRSHINQYTMYKREDVDQIQIMHEAIIDSFLKSCEILIREDLDDHEFRFCLDTIHNTINYVTQKRKKKNESKSG